MYFPENPVKARTKRYHRVPTCSFDSYVSFSLCFLSLIALFTILLQKKFSMRLNPSLIAVTTISFLKGGEHAFQLDLLLVRQHKDLLVSMHRLQRALFCSTLGCDLDVVQDLPQLALFAAKNFFRRRVHFLVNDLHFLNSLNELTFITLAVFMFGCILLSSS